MPFCPKCAREIDKRSSHTDHAHPLDDCSDLVEFCSRQCSEKFRLLTVLNELKDNVEQLVEQVDQ